MFILFWEWAPGRPGGSLFGGDESLLEGTPSGPS